MMDLAIISAAYNGLKSVKDIFSSFTDMKIETESLAKINDATKKVSEAQDTLFQIKDELFRLQEENNSLKKEISNIESWDKKFSNYELVKTTGNAVVYKSKSEPEHFICPSCAEKHSIQILQDNRTMSGKFRCIGCEGEYPVNPKQKMKPINYKSEF